MSARARPRLAVWSLRPAMDASFSCLTWRDELLTLAAEIEIANFPDRDHPELAAEVRAGNRSKERGAGSTL